MAEVDCLERRSEIGGEGLDRNSSAYEPDPLEQGLHVGCHRIETPYAIRDCAGDGVILEQVFETLDDLFGWPVDCFVYHRSILSFVLAAHSTCGVNLDRGC